jgi:hypothetical protein
MTYQQITTTLNRLIEAGDTPDQDITRAIAEWLMRARSDLELERVFSLLQAIGLHAQPTASLYSGVMAVLKESTNEEVAVRAMHILKDLVYYHGSKLQPSEAVSWLVAESSAFNRSSRAYKLAKSGLLATLLAQYSKDDSIDASISNWVLAIIAEDDEEYVDLAAFSIGNAEAPINTRLIRAFGQYIEHHPDAEASEEMAVSLARAGDNTVRQYILSKLKAGEASKPLVEAANLSKDAEVLAALDDLQSI